MYHEQIIAAREAVILRNPRMRLLYPQGVPKYSIADTKALTAQILQTVDHETGQEIRPLTPEESTFAAAASLRVSYDAPYYLEAFVWIDEEGHGIRPLYPLWESQRFVLARLAALEYAHAKAESRDGLLINILKARQLGVSTLTQSLVSHRIFTQPYVRAITGSDVEQQAQYLFKMIERIYAQLPSFLKPAKLSYKTGREMQLDNQSSIKAAWGKTTRGALQEEGGRKGNIERGRTNSVVGISELATWDNPEQLDSALFPGIPVSPSTLVVLESTAELAGDWWHRHWQTCQDGTTPRAWSNIFIPWCVEPAKYSLPAPDGWVPNDTTVGVASVIERDSAQWIGAAITLSKDQLYWYESTRAYFTGKNQLHQFLKEYPSNPEECFQYAGRSVFTFDEIQQIDRCARPLLDVWYVDPSRDIADLKRLPSADADKAAQTAADHRRYPPPVAVKIPSRAAEVHQAPPGYGFRRLIKAELDTLPSLRHTVLAIFEYPRLHGPRRYVLGVDVGDGLGQDYSVVSVVRTPTIEEPAEEVAQFISNTVRPAELAYIVDAIGHFYTDEDGYEALAAVELNNHGVAVQDMLQLHLGYRHFYVWEVVDAADASSRFTTRIGWQTTTRTRPILLEKFHDAVTAYDPISLEQGRPVADFRLNSPITRAELKFFVTEGLLGEAEHAKGQHDDCIFASAIGYYVAYRLSGGEAEPLAERRRRRSFAAAQAKKLGLPTPDWRNSPATAEAASAGVDDDADPDLTTALDHDDVYFDPRRHA